MRDACSLLGRRRGSSNLLRRRLGKILMRDFGLRLVTYTCDLDMSHTAFCQPDPLCRGGREIDAPTWGERTAIVDPDIHPTPVFDVCDSHNGSKRQRL